MKLYILTENVTSELQETVYSFISAHTSLDSAKDAAGEYDSFLSWEDNDTESTSDTFTIKIEEIE